MPSKTQKSASGYFHHPDYGYNCAQAITYHHGETAETLALMAKKGGGRAPQGICGALYGGLHVLRHDPEKQQTLKQAFCQVVGSPICREIKTQRLASCHHCIEVTDQVLQEMITELQVI